MLSRSDKLKRKKINKFLSFIVICVTLSILILPAFTLEKKDDDTNDNNGPTTAQNINERGGVETSEDSTLEPVVNNNDKDYSSNSETNIITNEGTDVILEPVNNEDSLLTVAETIDDEYTVDDEEPILLAEGGTATTTGFDLNAHPSNLDSIVISYKIKDTDDWTIVNSGDSNVIPANALIRLTVNFKDIPISELETNDRKIIYELPDILRNASAGAGITYSGSEVATVTVSNGVATIEFKEEFLNSLKTGGQVMVPNAYFRVQGTVNLKVLPADGKYTLTTAGKDFKFNFTEDAVAQYGKVDVKKECVSKEVLVVDGENYLSYTIKVTAGEDGAPDVTVVDSIVTDNKKIATEYVGVNTTSTALNRTKDSANPLNPYETLDDSKTSGSVYLGDVSTEAKPIPDSGSDINAITKPGVLVWKIGNMDSNESRTLTYSVKLKNGDNDVLQNNIIKNKADIYSKTYKRAYSESSFTPGRNIRMPKTVLKVTRNETYGTYKLEYRLDFELYKDKNNYPLKNFEFYDLLDYSDYYVHPSIRNYVNFDYDSVKLFFKKYGSTTAVEVDSSKYDVKWSDSTGNYKNLNEWTDTRLITRFKVSGSEGNPITVNPGDYYYVTYSLTVEPDVFAIMQNNKANINNRYLSNASNVNKKYDNIMDRVASSKVIGNYTWDTKSVGKASTSVSTITMPASDNKYLLNGINIENDSSSTSVFEVPVGSYRYTVNVNQTQGDWDATSVEMADEMNPKNMEYVGYVRIDACEYDSAKNKYPIKETKWVKVDGLNSFKLKPSDLGWTNNKYAYKFTYYAKPVNKENYSTTVVKNDFNLNGDVVGRNGQTHTLNNIHSQTIVRFSGEYSLNVNKSAWYYEPLSVGSWAKGKLYWVIEVDTSIIKQDTVFRDTIKNKNELAAARDKYTNSYLHDDSFKAYKGILPEGKTVTSYDTLDDLLNTGLLTDIGDKLETTYSNNDSAGFSGNNKSALDIKPKEDIPLTGGEKAYFIIMTEPSSVPQNYRDKFIFGNMISTSENNSTFVNLGTAQKPLCGGGDILKEYGSSISYDGHTITKDDLGGKGGNIAEDKIKEFGPGKYISWVFKVNYSGELTGSYRVLETVPDGMELAYIRIKWVATSQGTINSKEIADIETDGWIKKTITARSDNNRNETTTYYTKGNKALIELGDFKSHSNALVDGYAVDVQVVCRVTDPDLLLGAVSSKAFTNNVELQTETGVPISTAKSDATVTSERIDKNYIKSTGDEIDFTIVANSYKPGTSDKIKLIDVLSDTLLLDTKSIKVVDFVDNTDVAFTASYIKDKHRLEIEIPSGIPVKITYTASVNAPPDQYVSFSNIAYWENYEVGGTNVKNDNYKYEAGGEIFEGTNINLDIIKQDEYNTAHYLSGAEFEIVECTRNDDGSFTIDPSKPKATGTTDSNGELKFGTTSGYAMNCNTVYQVTETKAPDGYALDPTPQYIIVPRKVSGASEYSDYVKKCIDDNNIQKQYKTTFKLEITNRKGEIEVEKKFKNAGGNDKNPIKGEYKFGLYTDLGVTKIQEKSIIYNQADTASSATKTVKFADIDLNKTYYVYELDDSGNPIKDSTTIPIINGMEYITSYKTNNVDGSNGMTLTSTSSTGKVTVTNQVYTRQLPATGGNGIIGYIKSGAMLMLLAGVLLMKKISNKSK